MECPKCESNIKDVARFCEFCGHHFSSKEISARQVPQEEINTKTNEINVTESEIQLAPFYIRLLHSFIDHLTAWFIVFYINGYFEFIVGDLQDINNIHTVEIKWTIIIPMFLYWFIQELLMGRTIGKMITKTIIIQHNVLKPNVGQYALRALIISASIAFKLVEVLMLSFLVTFIARKKAFGFHDLLSKTMVVRER